MSAILEILIALPGAGKSTYAKNILKRRFFCYNCIL